MIYTLITIGAIMSIITATIFKSVRKTQKHRILKSIIIILISLLAFIGVCIFLIQQNYY